MSTRDIHIICRYQTHDETQFETMKKVAINCAQELNATALLIAHANDTKPDVKVYSDDFFAGRDEIYADGKEVSAGDADKSDETEEA